jgi:ferritin-like metal-binding protein YciE
MKLDSLEALLIDQLKDLYNAEQQLIKALPRMAKAATNPQLKEGFDEHLQQTREHAQRLEKIFDEMEIKGKGKKCAAMEGLIEEGKELMEEDAEPEVLDAGLIAAAQKVEHYEIASYGTARTYAQVLSLNSAADLLQQTLDEEKLTDRKLTQLAEESINVEAVEPGEDDEEMEEEEE